MKNEFAFPSQRNLTSASIGVSENTGMTLRDYFAAQIVQGSYVATDNPWTIARWAYKVADAMIEVRNEANK